MRVAAEERIVPSGSLFLESRGPLLLLLSLPMRRPWPPANRSTQVKTLPDIASAILQPRPDRHRKAPAGPEYVLPLIEIADSSLKYDRVVKQPLYARYGIPEFWIVDVGGQEVEVCRTPTDDGYASVVGFGRGETLVHDTTAGRDHPCLGALLG
jgi:Uma2 family endonuclease